LKFNPVPDKKNRPVLQYWDRYKLPVILIESESTGIILYLYKPYIYYAVQYIIYISINNTVNCLDSLNSWACFLDSPVDNNYCRRASQRSCQL
jgi:hypothetical protein